MKWLKKYVDFDLSPQALSDRLMMLGIETEAMRQLGKGLDGVVVGRINAVRRHPKADKLVLCDVDVGEGNDLQIVCGAPNAREGLIAPVACVGAQLPNGMTIKAAKLRGETSQGMLCSEKELAISDETSGLMELPGDLQIGMPLVEALGLDDAVLELEVTPNRPDCLSMIGVAREIRVSTGNPLNLPQVDVQEGTTDIRALTSVTIEAPDLCPRYAARVIRGVKIASSPTCLQRRLEAIGVGAINNVVDITNFVLMEYGHPLHAFDYHRLAENRIVVRRAQPGECLKTIDEETHTLTSDMLVIADAEKAVALAGVMGGFDSEIIEQTVDVLLESAYFHPPSIRKTSKALGMHTEASHRFERGADPEGVIPAINRAAQLIAEIAGGEVCAGIIDAYPGKREAIRIALRPERVNFVLGTDIAEDSMRDILTRLGFSVSDAFEVTVPTFRPDVEREVDLIEEVARVYGYDNIPVTLPTGDIPTPMVDARGELRERVKTYLLGCGMMEAINYSFCHSNILDRIRLAPDDPLRQVVSIRNPLSEELSIMRTTLLPGLLENAQRNRNHQVNDVQFFELSKVFLPVADRELPDEPERLAGIIAGNVGSGVYGDSFRPADFFDIKGVVEGLLDLCGISDYTLDRADHPTFHPGRCAEIRVKGERLCLFGEAHPAVLENYNLSQKAYLFELDFDRLTEAAAV
ncbi:MAG: phenylalanine--tRNA ligase subunit beta, partial [Candidatus Poribacteria bacterium]|nr:phenylalanine--tRNA ligase subunit beta [Candidatus Poribacteria bacterium]